MLDRFQVALIPLFGGGALGALIWLFAVGQSSPAPLLALEAQLSAIRSVQPKVRATSSTGFQALATPLFPTAPAGPELALNLEGVASFPGRAAALLSVNGAPAQWLALGETRDGVAVQDVSASRVLVATANGVRELTIGGEPAAPSTQDALPPGVKQPPPPASAPGATP